MTITPLQFENLQAIQQFTQKLYPQIKQGGTIFLQGALGAGKTTFVKYLAQAAGLPFADITSPTYSYINTHKIPHTKQLLVHVDLYRLETTDPELQMEISQYDTGHNIILIEWPSRLSPQSTLQPTHHFEISKN